MSDHTHGTHEPGEIPPANTAIIWRTFIILSVITAFEFTMAYLMKSGPLRTTIFVTMTLVKAFYIVGEFMHLKHEVKSLIWIIVIPTVFIIWLLVALLREGASIEFNVFGF